MTPRVKGAEPAPFIRYHVDLHLEVDPEMTVRESHDIASAVKNRIKSDIDWVEDVLVHVEPFGVL